MAKHENNWILKAVVSHQCGFKDHGRATQRLCTLRPYVASLPQSELVASMKCFSAFPSRYSTLFFWKATRFVSCWKVEPSFQAASVSCTLNLSQRSFAENTCHMMQSNASVVVAHNGAQPCEQHILCFTGVPPVAISLEWNWSNLGKTQQTSPNSHRK